MEPSSQLQTLFSSAKAGDKEAFRVLYGMLSPRVFRFIRPRARSRADALDALQETFIDFWKGLPGFSYQGDASLDALLYRIASRKVARTYRWWRMHRSLESMDDIGAIEGATAMREDVIDALAGLRMLGARDQEILVLRHMEGRSFADISQLLGESENTLKVRHHRAIARLRIILDHD